MFQLVHSVSVVVYSFVDVCVCAFEIRDFSSRAMYRGGHRHHRCHHHHRRRRPLQGRSVPGQPSVLLQPCFVGRLPDLG
uniref:Putative secreted protein n=1 Tax=Anopheles marajoara TaxID=58244 RepID=A0A2M4CC90_9DIPT